MTKRMWMSPAEMAGSAPAAADEFGPEVHRAIAELRSARGIASPSEVALPAASAEATAIDRRSFLQLTGAAAVLAMTAAGCAKHPDVLAPHKAQPDGATIGEGVFYSTVVRDGGRPVPAMVKTYDGRPIKIEGNPDDPKGRGRADLHTQAALLNLYDPDRIGLDPHRPMDWEDGPRARTGNAWAPTTWTKLDAAVAASLKSGGVALLTGPVDGPAHAALIAALQTAYGDRFRHVAWSAFADDAAAAARGRAFGAAFAQAPVIDPAKASVIVTLGSCLLAGGTTGLYEQVAFGDFRRVRGVAGGNASKAETGQLFAFEPNFSQTGAMADTRVRVAPEQLLATAWALAAAVADALGKPLPSAAAAFAAASKPAGKAATGVAAAAQALIDANKAGRHSLVYVGGAVHQGPNGQALHAAANWLNLALGNEGVTIAGDARSTVAVASNAAAKALLADCAAGKVQTLLIADADVVGVLPGAAAALAKVPCVVALSARRDATANLAHFQAPGLHSLESWGDAETAPGLYAVQQPTLPPLWDARAWQESALAFTVLALGDAAPAAFRVPAAAVAKDGGPTSLVSRRQLWPAAVNGVQSWHGFVAQVWQTSVRQAAGVASDARAFWNAALARGVLQLAAPAAAAPTAFDHAAATPAAPKAAPLALILSPSRTMQDGRNLNNAWLQECPDPVSKITWDGYLAVSPTDAKSQGWAENQVVQLSANGATVKTVVHVQEGQHPGTLELYLGWGRPDAGAVAAITSKDGFPVDGFALQGADGERWGIAATVSATGATYVLANVQMHHRMEGRAIALDDTLAAYREDPSHAKRKPHHALWENGSDGKPDGNISLWGTTHAYPGHRWGMAVDLSVCTGCNACVAACNAENNIPVVGRDEVRKGRELHWIRVDRYYSSTGTGDDALLDVELISQPVMCQQCDNAPCEAVCPANATMKNDEGVNVQVYNRCIGTRYCSNNCPYKVRRFNWYQYSQMRAGPIQSEEPLGRIVRNVLSGMSTKGAEELAHMPLQLMLNPEVTVRHRGVMEKCNLCLQRTRKIKDTERTTGAPAKDGATTTACAQTCPTAAITFGDLNDPSSQVATLHQRAPDAYKILDKELNTKPKVAYLRRIRNRPQTEAEAAAAADHAKAH